MDKENKVNHSGYEIEDVGQVQIADEVIAVIAGLAATEVDGVQQMSGNITNEIVSKLGMKNLSKGVKVSIEVQEKVKGAIETMTGLTVNEVNIRIAGIQTESE